MKKVHFLWLFLLTAAACSKETKQISSPQKTPTPVNTGVNSTPTEPITTTFSFKNLVLLDAKLEFKTLAVGRDSKVGANDFPTVSLVNSGFTHPSVVYIKNGFNGYKYWCALTPHFGPIDKQTDFTAFENPTIFCSNDGKKWMEPAPGINPIDRPFAGPFISYWSDTHLVSVDDRKLYMFYRGNGFPKNYYQDGKYDLRAVVSKNSDNGIQWSARKLLYSSTTSGVDDSSMIVSPAIVKDSTKWFCYDIQYSTTKNPIAPQGNQSIGFVVRRADNVVDGSYGSYKDKQICQFSSRPWGEANDPWHIDAIKYDNTFFLLICAGLKGKSNGDSLYLAYSKDGVNFDVIQTPLFAKNTYRSCLVPLSSSSKEDKFWVYQSDKTEGNINLYELTLGKP